MAFPTTSVLDNFTGTNGTDLASYPTAGTTNWAAIGGITEMEIQSNAATGTVGSSGNADYWKTATFGADTEAYCTVTTKTASGLACGVLGRFDPATINGYICLVDALAGTDNAIIQTLTGGVGSTILTVAQEFSAGDGLGLESIGNTHTIYRKSGGTWSALGNVSNSTYTVAGRIAIYGEDTACRLDDFGGGTVVAASTAVLSSAGRATGAFTSQASTTSTISAAGLASTTFIGQAGTTAILASAGVASANIASQSLATVPMASAGLATVNFVGTSQAGTLGALSAAGISTVAFGSQTGATAAMSAAGAASVRFVGTTASTTDITLWGRREQQRRRKILDEDEELLGIVQTVIGPELIRRARLRR